MKNEAMLKANIEKCTTKAQLMKVLKDNGLKISKDESKLCEYFSVWIDELTRIYKPFNSKTFKFQKMRNVEMNYSGIPTFFGYDPSSF